MEFDYTVATNKNFDEMVKTVQKEITKAGMRVLYIYDIQKTLVKKGLKENLLKLLNFTIISGIRPIVLPKIFSKVDLGEKPKEIDQIIKNN